MTTAKRIPPHGTEYRYRGPVDGSWPGCRCPKCTQAQARAGKVRALARLRGEDALHPAEPVVEHIRTLHASGMSYACIARQAGVANNTVTYLARGISKKCRRDRALRILAVKPAEFDTRADRPAFMAIRRLRALYAIGHNPATIGAAANLDPSTISHVANGRYETVEATTDLGVRRAYAKLSTVAGSSTKARKRAAALGWHGPLDWDDIDNPDCKPEPSRKSRAQESARPKVYADPARVAELTKAGRTAQEIADELGCHKRTVVRARGRVTAQANLQAAA